MMTVAGETRLSLVTGQIFESEAASQKYLRDHLVPLVPLLTGREEVGPFANPVGYRALRMVVSVFPADGELPSLIAATDRIRMAAIFNDVLPGGEGNALTAEDCQIELVDLARQHRATLRYVVGRPGYSSAAATRLR